MDTTLKKMLRDHSLPLWRANELQTTTTGIPTGFAALNALLPDQGWTPGTLLELIYPQTGAGELRLLLPTLAHYTRQQRYVAWIAPPHIPYGPALAQHHIDPAYISVLQAQTSEQQHYWCMEKLLACRECGVAMLWPRQLPERNIRRLQLAASKGDSLGILLHPQTKTPTTSPAATRIQLEMINTTHIQITLLKARSLLRPARTQISLPL